MQTKRLGNTDLELTRIGLGTWAIGGGGWDYSWGAQEDQESIGVILEALEAGINWIDTAAVYGLGHSEEIVGKAVREWGRPVILATKCGLLGDEKGHVSGCLKKDSIRKECEVSLKRLQTERIDLYQIHWPNPAADIEEGFETLVDLQKQGKIRYAALSNFSVKQMDRVRKIGDIASLQPPYSLLNRGIENEILPYCALHQMGVICYSPMQNGLLTGKMTKEWVDSLPFDDWRKTKSDFFREPALTQVIALTERLKSFASKSGHTVSQAAISWVLRRKEVTAAIVGARRKGQILETIRGVEWDLSEEDLSRVEEMFRDYCEGMKKNKKTKS